VFNDVTLTDEVGIDISAHVGAFMAKADLGVRLNGGRTELMQLMVQKGWLGRKSEKGFFLYPKNAKKGAEKQLNPEMVTMLKDLLAKEGIISPSKESVEDIQGRIISRFVNEAAFCLQDGIIRAPADGALLFLFVLIFGFH
jgi:enoyl-CoA hydratase/long-chain 3-hydroxyacyl-CoA dehydrogenase